MYDTAFIRGDAVVGCPRRGTKTAGPIAFDLVSGTEVDVPPVSMPRDQADVQLLYFSSAVGKGPSTLSLYQGNAESPFVTTHVPDAISQVAEASFGWFVGCRDGFLYGLDRCGQFPWRWETPRRAQTDGSDQQPYFAACPYHVISSGESALVSSWSKVWSVSSNGETEWEFRVPGHEPQESAVTLGQVFRSPTALARLGLTADASEEEIRRAYRAAAEASPPDLESADPRAVAGFRRILDAPQSLDWNEPLIRMRITVSGSGGAAVSFLSIHEDAWLVGSGAGEVIRLSRQGQITSRLRLAKSGQTWPVLDGQGHIAGFAGQRTLWLVDQSASVELPDAYQWPFYLCGSFGSYVLAHRSGDSHLALIDDQGRLAVRVKTPRAITCWCVGPDTLVVVAGALICLDIKGLHSTGPPRAWRLPLAP